jgi:hypothetical protein
MIGLNLDSTGSIHASADGADDDRVGNDGTSAELDVVFSSTDDEVEGAQFAHCSFPSH